uniref:Cadherin domain-containing protein n=1 Tax=Strongyloides papillosus TaxID=174720 RepID=A0A0N5C523_STREA
CHIVLDGFEDAAFNDFYGPLYLTSLLMFDEKNEKYIKVDSVQNLVSNRMYKCALIINANNSKFEKPDYIKETEFSINIIYEKDYNHTGSIISTTSNSFIGSNTSIIYSNSVGSNNSSVADSSSKTNNFTDSNNSKI